MSAILVHDDTSDQYKVVEPLCKIGAAPSNSIVITAEGVSPMLLRIEKKGEDYFAALEPGATPTRKHLFFFDIPNCTVNRQPLTSRPVKLSSGDKIQVGSKLLVFHIS